MTITERYLDLLKHALTFTLWPEPATPLDVFNPLRPPLKRLGVSLVTKLLRRRQLVLAKDMGETWEERSEGKTWPMYAHTMVGLRRLNHLQQCIETALRDRIPGDVIETGAWRGGTCIFMRGVLAAHNDLDRKVYVADSFQGLPRAKAKQDVDADDPFPQCLAASESQVRENFRRYGLLDDQVVFLSGWFEDTLPAAPIKQLAVLRLDGDMYGSTMVALSALYPKLSPGGFCIVDDYGLPPCKQAVMDYRAAHGITIPIETIDFTATFWRKV